MLRLGFRADTKESIELTLEERRQGTYVIGTTGTGKSTLLKNIILQDLEQDLTHGLCLLDPHGDLIDSLLGMVPDNRLRDVILFNPMDTDKPFGLNLLACDRDDPHQVRWVVSTIMGTLRRLFYYSWGPRLEHVLRHSLLTAMTLEDATFIELVLLLSNESYREKVTANMEDPILTQFWDSFPRSERLRYELTSSTLNKISPFITDRSMRNIIGQSENTINLREVMDEGKILFVNLSKGDLGEENSSLLGAVIVNLILISALQRRSIPEKKRLPFHLIVDEFQNFATESFAILQSEARKYAVDVVVAHQYRDQLDDLSKGSTLNVGNTIVFRTTGMDGFELSSQFDNTPPPPETVMEPVYRPYKQVDDGEMIYTSPKSTTGVGTLYHEKKRIRRTYSDMQAEKANKLSILPNYEAWCRLIFDPKSRGNIGKPRMVEYNFDTEDMKKREQKIGEEKMARTAAQIRENSRKLGKSRAVVEAEIHLRSLGVLENDEPGSAEPLD